MPEDTFDPNDQSNPAGPFDPATDGRALAPTNFPDCDPDNMRKRRAGSYRVTEADRACERDLEPRRNRNNREEWTLKDPETGERIYAANNTKGMPHNDIGEVIAETDDNRKAYERLLIAVNTTDPADYEAIPTGPNKQVGPPTEIRRLVDPQAGVAFDLEGPDAPSAATYRASLTPERMLVAPRFETPWLAADVGEVYLMALARDVPLNKLSGTGQSSDPRVRKAVELINQFSDYRGPVIGGQVTPQTLFRGGNILSQPKTGDQSQNVGELDGPHLSQFLLIGSRLENSFPPQRLGGGAGAPSGAQGMSGLQRADGQVVYGTLTINQRQFEVEPGLDFITDYNTWLSILQGVEPSEMSRYTTNRRFLYSLRQAAEYVHRDQTYQEGLIACLLIISMFERAERVEGLPPLFNPGNPYLDSGNQMGFGTFGNGHILALLAEATTRAIKAAWYQKWYNQRRLRPETLGGRIHNVRVDPRVKPERYSINPEITGIPVGNLTNTAPGAEIMNLVRQHNLQQNQPDRPTEDSFLLPQQYPEGSPTHPSYPAGHATQIAAEATVLKGIWNEDFPITGPEDRALVPNDDGTALVEYTGPGGRDIVLTLGRELNKLAANVSLMRSFAGVHYRLDYTESALLGEYVGLGILQEQARSFNNENHFFELTLFSGIKVRVLSTGEIVEV